MDTPDFPAVSALADAAARRAFGHPAGCGDLSPQGGRPLTKVEALALLITVGITAREPSTTTIEMQRRQMGSNDMAKRLEALTLTARNTAEAQDNAMGLELAKAQLEEEQLKAEEKHQHDRKEIRRKSDQEAVAATAASTHEAMQLHSELQGIKGTQLDTRIQERVACTITTTRVMTIKTSL